MSRYTLLLVLVVATTSTTFGQICPPALDMAPCICLEESKSIECIGMKFPFDIKSVFDRVGPLVDESVVFNQLTIYSTIIQELPAGTVESLKFETISIWSNANLTHISPDAFNASTEVTTKLSISNNVMLADPINKEKDLFAFVSKFEKLDTLQVTNQLTAIPDDAFGPLPSLTKIDIYSNSIASIGSRAFAQLPNLTDLSLNFNNNLTAEGVAPEAFEGISSTAVVDLEDTRIEYLPEETFKRLLDNSALTYVGGAHCTVNGCNFKYLYCDERVNWICENQEFYENKVNRFRCYEPEFEFVWDYCSSL